MLHKITVENFFSIADRQELTFAVPANAPDLVCFRSSPVDKNIRLPTVVGIFGPNASGKSTLLRAIFSSVIFACKSFEWENTGQIFQPYRQKDWSEKPTKIIIDFDNKLSDDTDLTMFRYELHIAHFGDFQNKQVLYEALSYAPKGRYRSLFERIEQKFHFGHEFGIANKDDPRKESIRPNASVISTLAKLNHPLSSYISQQMNMLQMSGFDRQSANPWLEYYHRDKNCLDHLNRALRRFDVGLECMLIEQGERGLFAKFQHTGLDDFIFFPEESAGTQRFIEIFPRLHYALETGSIAVVDEIDTDLHPLLLPELFWWFSSLERNPHGAQLLFTAHNPALLDKLQKEQVFFTEKPCGQSTRVYGARDIKGLRREPSLMKKYLSGELGAVPHIG